MKIVATNSDQEIDRNDAENQLDYALRELTANLLRITRGAGRPVEVASQAAEFLLALKALRQIDPHFDYGRAIAQALVISSKFDTNGRTSSFDTAERAVDSARQTMVRGALQVAASRLLRQRTQEAAGNTELNEGHRSLEESRSAARRAYAEALGKRSAATPLKPKRGSS